MSRLTWCLLIFLLTIPLCRPTCQESPTPPALQDVLSLIESGRTYKTAEVREIVSAILLIADDEIQHAADGAAQAVADRCNADKAVLVDARQAAEKRAAEAQSAADFWRGCTVGVGVSAVLLAILAAVGYLVPR